MNLLLDECVPRRLKRSFIAEGHSCSTVAEVGLAGKTNGELLRLAQSRFQVLITLDKGLPHQQNLAGLNIAVLLIHASSNRAADVVLHIPACLIALRSVRPGEIVHVGVTR